jgi:hypothetical protein
MPNKYEREIEEILRNMERTEPPRQGLSDRIRAFNRPRPRPQRGWRAPLNATESLFVLSILLTLAAASLTFYLGQVVIVRLPVIEVLTVNGILAFGAFIALVAALLRGWRDRFRLSSSTPGWRGNVIEMRPARRNPFGALVTQFRIFRLKFRYWRSRGKE